MLINRNHGSYFIIGSLLLNQKLNLEAKGLDVDHCGTCTACADACPTNAIDLDSRTLRAQDCISTFTIEIMKEAAPPKGYEQSRGEVFGCDICQDVCPWNRKPLDKESAIFSLHEQFEFLKEYLQLPNNELKDKISAMTGRGFQKVMRGTALGRPGKRGWLKNFL
jgi:epoxyqueuosine reductase